MEVQASAKYLRISPRKLRLLTHGLVGLNSKKALSIVSTYPQKGSLFLEKVFKQAIANAKNNFKLSEDELVVKSVEVGDGPSFKRMDKSHGARFDRGIIQKRTSHLYVTLETKNKENKTKETEVKKENKEGKPKRTEKTEIIKKNKALPVAKKTRTKKEDKKG
ncbi:50S ribosomal protein L22 [Candidatus Microgenomates bacterium]|jgi:large subunit ribosomal protein L22|nr:MAG: 50S ribosomal protein L22 [Candidatus Microgenomates bacterium]